MHIYQLPGATIEVHCDIVNNSTTDCIPRVTLFQKQIYLFAERHKACQVEKSLPIVGECVTKESNSYQKLTLTIPTDVDLSIITELIVVKYFIHVTLDIPHALDIHVDLPIVVTTVSAPEFR